MSENESRRPPDATPEMKTNILERIAIFLKEAWPVRNTDLLSKRIASYQRERQNSIPEAVYEQYKQEKEYLTVLFGDPTQKKLNRNLLFHGTGLLKYDGEKFQNSADHDKTVPVLEQIIEKGMLPQQDPFLPEEDVRSISLVESYFYAKWFADKSMNNANEMQFQFGKPSDWFTFFLADTGKWVLENLPKIVKRYFVNREQIRQTKKTRSTISPVIGWVGGTRNDISPTMPYKEMMKDILDGHSTIPENWGAVVCIDKGQIETNKVGAHETRTSNAIKPQAIKAIGVPFNRLGEAKTLLEKSNSKAILFSLESAEIHLSAFPIKELAKRLE